MRTLLTLLLLCVGLALAGCRQPAAEKQHARVERTRIVAVAQATHRKVNRGTTVTGTLTVAQHVQIFNQEPGRIISLPFREGDAVARDAELVRLDGEVIKAQLDKAVAQRRRAQADYKRLEKLVQRKLASDIEVGSAKTEVALARAEEQLQRTLLARSSILAPFDGVVSERLKEPGDVATVHTHILTLINPRSLIAEVGVSELLLPALQVGSPVEVRIDALGSDAFAGAISRIHPVVNPGTREGTIEVALNPAPPGAVPGQHCRIMFTTEVELGLAIPARAMGRDSDGPYAWRIDASGAARRTALETGVSVGPLVQILAGLSEGDQVIVKGLLGLRDGEQVVVAEAADEPAGGGTL